MEFQGGLLLMDTPSQNKNWIATPSCYKLSSSTLESDPGLCFLLYNKKRKCFIGKNYRQSTDSCCREEEFKRSETKVDGNRALEGNCEFLPKKLFSLNISQFSFPIKFDGNLFLHKNGHLNKAERCWEIIVIRLPGMSPGQHSCSPISINIIAVQPPLNVFTSSSLHSGPPHSPSHYWACSTSGGGVKLAWY